MKFLQTEVITDYITVIYLVFILNLFSLFQNSDVEKYSSCIQEVIKEN